MNNFDFSYTSAIVGTSYKNLRPRNAYHTMDGKSNTIAFNSSDTIFKVERIKAFLDEKEVERFKLRKYKEVWIMMLPFVPRAGKILKIEY